MDYTVHGILQVRIVEWVALLSSRASSQPRDWIQVALTRRTFVSKVASLLFKMLSRIVIAFISRSKHLLISGLQSPSAVILEPKKIKSVTVSIVSPSICYEVMGPDAMILVFWMLSFKPAFSLSSFIMKLKFLFAFCHKGSVICISEWMSEWKSFSHVWLFVTPWSVACEAPLSMKFSRQEWVAIPSPGDLPNPGIEPRSPIVQGFLYHLSHQESPICISEVIYISPGNLDSSLCFIQPSILHDALCMEVKQAGWQYTTLTYSFPSLEPVHYSMSGSNCCFLFCIQFLQKGRKLVWYFHPFKNFPVYFDLHSQRL